jgi:hypothetical protein
MDEGPNPGEMRNRGCDWAVFHRPDEKKRLPGASSGSWLEMLLVGAAGGDTSEGDMFTTLDTNIKVIAWEEDRIMDKFGRERGRGTRMQK